MLKFNRFEEYDEVNKCLAKYGECIDINKPIYEFRSRLEDIIWKLVYEERKMSKREAKALRYLLDDVCGVGSFVAYGMYF